MIQTERFIRILIAITFVVCTNCQSNIQYSELCEQHPKYYDTFNLPDNIIGYNNFRQAVNCAKKINKPLAVYFTANTCNNCQKFEEEFLSLEKVSTLLNEHFVFVALFVDDKTPLPKADQFLEDGPYSDNQKLVKTIGQLNCILLPKYPHSSHPSLFLTDKNGAIRSFINYDTNTDTLFNKLVKTIEK